MLMDTQYRSTRFGRSCFLIFSGLVVSIISILSPLSGTVQAESKIASISNYQKTVIQRSLAEGLTECLQSGASGVYGSVDELIQADKSLMWGNRAPFVGPLTDSKDGRLSCDEIIKKVKSEFGYNTVYELVCDLGATVDNGAPCKDASGQDVISLGSDSANSVITTLERKINKKLPKNDSTLDYALALGSLTASDYGCSAQERSNLSEVDKKRSDNYKITVAMTDGTTKETYFYIPQARQDDDIQMFAQGFNRWANKPKLKCSDLVNWASRNASSFALSIKKDVAIETQSKVSEALMSMCLGGGSGNTIVDYCNTQVNKWLSSCQTLIPSSGNITDSGSFITCIEKGSGIGADKIKQALDGVSIAGPAELTPEGSEEGAVACAISGVGWIVCPVVNFLASVADMAFYFLADNFLSVPPSLMDTSGGTFTAWKAFVSFANITFVIIFLLMIYSQITGGGLSNYSLKKILPRLVIGAILVNLSFYLCTILIDFSNILGYGLKELLSSAAGSATNGVSTTWDQTGDGFSGVAGTVLAGGAGAGVAVAASGGVTLALVALLGVLFSGVIALIMIFLILMIRQVLIVLLVVVAPLAFVANILPNTEGLFKKWKSIFTSMLLLFPIVGLIYGASSLASKVIAGSYSQAGDDTGMLPKIIAAGVMILPLFVIPGVLKKSLDVVGGIGGKISGLGGKLETAARKKGEDTRLGQYSKHLASRNSRDKALTQAGSYNGKNIFRRGMSRVNRGINDSKTFNKMTGNFGLRSAATGVAGVISEENKQVEDQVTLINSGVDERDKISNAAKVLMEANNSGDIVRARAAQKILLGSGALGIQKVHDTIHQLETSNSLNQSVSSALRSDIVSSGIKGKDNTLASWAYAKKKADGTAPTIREAELNKSTLSSLNPVELAGQNIEDLREGQNIGSIDAHQAQSILDSSEAQSMLSQEKRELFTSIANGQPVNGGKRKARSRDETPLGANEQTQAPRRATPSDPNTP